MKYVSTLGDWTDHMEETWQDAKRFLDRLGREQESVDSAGYESSVIAAATDATESKLAWVETREKETSPGYWDVTHTLRALHQGEKLAEWELPTYNPFFGCEVGLLEWYGDEIAIVYREKHETLLAIFDAQTGSKGRLLPINDDWCAESGVVNFLSNEPGLIEICHLPDLQIGVPVPVDVNASHRHYVPKSHDGVEDFVGRVAALLFGDEPSNQLAEVLIGSAAYRFWDPWPKSQTNYGFRRRWNSPYWFPFYWYKVIDTNSQKLFVDWLDKLALMSFVDADLEDLPVKMAAEHVSRAAEDWRRVCQLESLPEDCRCYFWVDWSQKEFMRSLSIFPLGFREAYTAVKRTRNTKKGGLFGRFFGTGRNG